MGESGANDVQLARIDERLESLTREHSQFRTDIQEELRQLRKQTHDWLQVTVNKLPAWAIAVGGFMTTALGAMAMWIITHK